MFKNKISNPVYLQKRLLLKNQLLTIVRFHKTVRINNDNIKN